MFSTTLLATILLAAGPRVTAKTEAAAPQLPPLPATTITSASVTPGTISFNTSNPDSQPVVNGSATATVTWQTANSLLQKWTLAVSAPASFGSCGTVPASAVTVTCGTVSGGFGGTCGGATTISTTPVQIASGYEGIGTGTYTVALTFTLQDSWKYIASTSCSLSVTYTITAD
jgi:hypothetical protein